MEYNMYACLVLHFLHIISILQVIVIYFPTAWALYWLVIVVVGIAIIILIYLIRFIPLRTFYYLCYIL